MKNFKKIGIIGNIPASVQYLPKPVPAPGFSKISEPLRTADSYNDKERVKIELWLSACSIGAGLLNNGTKMLKHMGVLHSRNAIFDLIDALGKLRGYFNQNEDYKETEIEIENFVFSFLTMDKEHQKRVVKFHESLLDKSAKNSK